MAKFNVGDKVRVIDASHGWNCVSKGDEGVIVSINTDESYEAYIPTHSDGTWTGEAYCFELVTPKQTKNRRITALENEVAELKLIVHELRERPQLTTVVNNAPQEPSTTSTVEDIIEFEGKQYQKVVRKARKGDLVSVSFENGKCFKPNKIYGPVFEDKGLRVKADPSSGGEYEITLVYNDFYGRTHQTVDVYELIESKPLTPNQQRAAIIEKAKAFVKNIVGEHDTFNTTVGRYKDQCVRPIFYVNEKKRAITILIYGAFGKELIFKGLAKCNPSDVFNEHIGKAIALGRALGLDVSEFEQTVQPNVVVMGMDLEVRTNGEVDFTHKPVNADDLIQCNKDFQNDESGVFIINDTNAIYEEGQ